MIRRGRADFIRARRSKRPSYRGRIYDCICFLSVFFSREPLDSAGGSIYVGGLTSAEAGLSDRPAHQWVRVESWRDVRTGVARPLDADERLYVCRMDSYDEVLEQLFGVG